MWSPYKTYLQRISNPSHQFTWYYLFTPIPRNKKIVKIGLPKETSILWGRRLCNSLGTQPNLWEQQQKFHDFLRVPLFYYVTISWLCIGHTKLTHFFLFKQENQPECIVCQTIYTVKHILIECGEFANIRQCFYNINNIYSIISV